MTNTEKWLKKNGYTKEQAEQMGLLPKQQAQRAQGGMAALAKYGLKDTQEYRFSEYIAGK